MKKLTMKSVNMTQVNMDKIAELFPNVITEARDEHGKIKRAVDFDLLKQELSDVLVEGEKERYQLTWPGKKEAVLNANSSIDKTLRPIKEDSVDWDTTQNMYIEGDNLEVLKLLQESYINKIKMIYIDPPYNTGKDFIYKDDFREPVEEYLEESGQVDEERNRLFQNTESNGRFHSDWLTMIYSRLKLARNLLKDDGVIFISIDDSEVDNLKKVCNEIFGSKNFICCFVWKSKLGKVGTTSTVSTVHEYVLSYAKNVELVNFKKIIKKSDGRKENLRQWGQADRREDRPSMYYPIIIDGITVYPIKEDGSEGRWRVGKEKALELLNQGLLQLVKRDNNRYEIYRLFPESESQIAYDTFIPTEVGTTANGAIALQQLNMSRSFDYSKPKELLSYLMTLADFRDGIICDFFSGSATTAHGVMELNANDGGTRKYILVQLPEEIDETSEAYSAGYKNICEIGKERIRRAAKKIKEETGADIDYGFRVFRVDSSNMKDVYYTPDKLGQMNLDDLTSNIKEDRTGEDLLIQVMLECGLELSLPMESKEIEGKTVYYVAENSLIACFDEDVPESVIKKIAADQPLRVVFRDSSFRDDSARINVEELFKLLSPSTDIQVL
ncbi:site-specific DNA-methyltransferase [Paenibacillus cisolokensis]|uniref:site-specific DNA-methyltransferase n=1 Tax=Paenibacillus cisolokensis TaxID=1658519 RepID=UPI003D2A0C9C